MITGKELAEKLYSENEKYYESEKLYSTGDDELDDLLERAFCDGYEYAQREFAKIDTVINKNALNSVMRDAKYKVPTGTSANSSLFKDLSQPKIAGTKKIAQKYYKAI